MNRSGPLDLVRGLAAFLVMICHLRSIVLVPFQDLAHKGIVERVFYFFTGFGHQCVIIFFALSGYFVGAAYHRNFEKESISLHTKKYVLNRLARLWTVLIPALLLTLLVDSIGQMVPAGTAVYTTGNYFPFIPLSNARGLLTFLGNVFFVQTIAVPTLGTNSALWSLANEFWYYMLFPALYVLFVNRVSITIKSVLAPGVIAICYWLGHNNMELLEGFVVWLLGFGVYRLTMKPSVVVRIVFVLIFGAVLFYSRIAVFPHSMLIVGVPASLLIIAIRDLQLTRLDKVADFLAKISYTLYLIHLPLVVLASVMIFDAKAREGDWLGMAIVVIGSLVIIAISYGVYFLFERRTDDVRAIAGRWLLRGR